MSLSGNTEKINELISKINALPEAGSGGGSGGGSVETCTVNIVYTIDSSGSGGGEVLYSLLSKEGTIFVNSLVMVDGDLGFSFDCVKGSVLCTMHDSDKITFSSFVSDGCDPVWVGKNVIVWDMYDNTATITINAVSA